jgi:hypothetical protein
MITILSRSLPWLFVSPAFVCAGDAFQASAPAHASSSAFLPTFDNVIS